MSKKSIPNEVIQAACTEYMINGNPVNEIALSYGISPSTLARGLAERGERQLKKYKTKNEYEMIQFLRNHGITTAAQLRIAVEGEREPDEESWITDPQ